MAKMQEISDFNTQNNKKMSHQFSENVYLCFLSCQFKPNFPINNNSMSFQRKKPSFLKQFARNFVLRSDMFAAQPTLRFGGQANFETIFGGFLSIILVLSFMIIFSTTFYNVLTKVNVSAVNDIEDDPFGTHEIEGIQIAIGIKGLDCTANQRYFGIFMDAVTIENGVRTQVPIQLQPCNRTIWNNYQERIGTLFTTYEMDEMLCPVPGSQLIMKGFQENELWKTVDVRVEKCDNTTASGYTCYPQATIDSFFSTYVTANDFFKVQLYVLDTEISPTHSQYLSRILEKQIFLTFSDDLGSRGIVRMSHYEVLTDTSIWPFPITTNETGHYIDNFQTHAIELYSTHYVKIIIQKSRKMYSVSRSHDKFDGMLSYVGGLFALIFGWMFFFIGSFSEYRYELSVAENTFSIDESGKKMREKSFGFLTYLQYAMYDWLRTFNIKVAWKKPQQIDEVRSQAAQQLDVRYILKQLQHFSLVNKLLLEEHRLIYSHLARHPTLQEVKKVRKISEYYDKIITDEALLENNQSSKQSKLQDFHHQNFQNHHANGIAENDSDFDSDDQQAQNTIVQAIKKGQERNDELIKKIPNALRKRLKLKEEFLKGQTNNMRREIQVLDASINSSQGIMKSREEGFGVKVNKIRPTNG